MDVTGSGNNSSRQMQQQQRKQNQNIQVYVRVRPLNSRERCIRSTEVIDVVAPREIVTRHTLDSKLTKKFTFDRTFGPESRQVDVYSSVVSPLIEEVLSGYNCTVFAYGQTGTGKTHTMVGTECAELKSSWEDDSEIGIIPRALSHLFDELRLMEVEYTMRISYLELYNEELCDLLSTDDNTKIRIFDDSTKKGSVIIQGLEEIPVHSKDDVYKLLEKGKERRKTATTLMNAQSSRSHTVFSILVHIRENGIEGEDMLKIGKLNLVDLAGSENVSKAGNEKGIRVRETVNINQSLLTLGRVITALVERTPHIPYRESKLTRLLQESLGGRTKTSIIATISPGHKDIEETLSTLEYAHRAKNIQNRPEVNQKLTKKTVLKEYTEEIDKLKRDLMAARDKNGIYLAEETYTEMTLKMDSQNRELNEKMLLLKALKDELANKEKIFNEVSLNLVEKTQELKRTEKNLTNTKGTLFLTKKALNSTKRRYKEKKALLESHVKTEKELTNQAAQILDVADVATNDTFELHNTIDRRKDVDNKIRTASEIFTERMKENFDIFEGSLSHFQDKHSSSTQYLGEELAKCTEAHLRLLTNSEKSVQNIRKIFVDSLNSNCKLHEEFVQISMGMSEEHKTKLSKLFDNLKNKEANMKAAIEANIHEIEGNNELQKTTVDKLRETVAKTVNYNTEAISKHIEEMQAELMNITDVAKSNFEELNNLQAELNNENALIEQEQLILDDFVHQMQQIKDLRLRNAQNMFKYVGHLDANNKTTMFQVQQDIKVGQLFDKQCREQNEASKQNIEQQIETSLLSIDQNVAKCSTLQVQLDNLCQESSAELASFATSENEHFKQTQQKGSNSQGQFKHLCVDEEQKVDKACGDMYKAINEETQRLRGHVAVASVHIKEMETHLLDYAKVHKKNLNESSTKVVQFQENELKTYSSTGTTPSKREFIYPRVLAKTSPHQDIVKRYRHEHDWSDMDTTVPIDEVSESEIEPNSVQEFSETQTLLNSTPVAPSEIVQKSCSFNNNPLGVNNLKQPQKRSSSLTTPRKASPRHSLALRQINKDKENMG